MLDKFIALEKWGFEWISLHTDKLLMLIVKEKAVYSTEKEIICLPLKTF